MQGVYKANANFSVSTAKTLMWIKAPPTASLEIMSVRASNVDNETNEQLPVAITRVTTEGTPAGTGVTPQPTETKSATSGVTSALCLADLSAEPTTYATPHLEHEGISTIGAYRYQPIPEGRDSIEPGESLGLRLLAAPAAAFEVSVQIVYREI